MRLVRRLTQSIRNHDWFFVVVDVLVLVLGLLLAFQVDRWWEATKRRQDERAFLERLWDESVANVAASEELGTRDREVVSQLLEIQRALPNPARLRRLQETSGYGCGMMHLPALRLEYTAYEELAGANRLDVLTDPLLRRALRRALAEHAFTAAQLDYFRANFVAWGSALGRFHDYQVDLQSGEVDCSLRLPELARDPEAVQLLGQVYRNQRVFMRIRERERETLRQVNRRLGCLLEKPECRRD